MKQDRFSSYHPTEQANIICECCLCESEPGEFDPKDWVKISNHFYCVDCVFNTMYGANLSSLIDDLYHGRFQNPELYLLALLGSENHSTLTDYALGQLATLVLFNQGTPHAELTARVYSVLK